MDTLKELGCLSELYILPLAVTVCAVNHSKNIGIESGICNTKFKTWGNMVYHNCILETVGSSIIRFYYRVNCDDKQ